ncbi:MAG: transporter substrate-binding domain-containing protein [Desulfobaccales bacterium]
MENLKKGLPLTLIIVILLAALPVVPGFGADLPDLKARGVLRHLGVPYANFVTRTQDGMDVELVKLFAQDLGVKYEYVETSWENILADLTGKKVKAKGANVRVLGEAPIKGDLIACGFTILPWREKIIDYSTSTFPTQVWLIAQAESPQKPITPAGDIDQDITAVKAMLKGHSLLVKINTCLDPSLYNLEQTGAKIKLFPGGLNELAPAVLNGEAQMTLLDVPDALIALGKWPGKIKVIGPLSRRQEMGAAFTKDSPQLRQAFNRFLEKCQKDGTYLRLVKKYYPDVLSYFPDFFEKKKL